MKLQIDFTKEMSDALKIYKIKNNFNTQQEVITYILQEVLFCKEEDGTRGE